MSRRKRAYLSPGCCIIAMENEVAIMGKNSQQWVVDDEVVDSQQAKPYPEDWSKEEANGTSWAE